MCHYITGTFESNKIGIEHINAIGKDFGLQFVDCKNDFIHAQLDSKEHYIAKVSKEPKDRKKQKLRSSRKKDGVLQK